MCTNKRKDETYLSSLFTKIDKSDILDAENFYPITIAKETKNNNMLTLSANVLGASFISMLLTLLAYQEFWFNNSSQNHDLFMMRQAQQRQDDSLSTIQLLRHTNKTKNNMESIDSDGINLINAEATAAAAIAAAAASDATVNKISEKNGNSNDDSNRKNNQQREKSKRREAPYELDATKYDINMTEMIEHWLQAQKVLDLKEIDAKSREQYIRNWNRNSQARSNSEYKGLNITYNIISKVASEEINANFRSWNENRKRERKNNNNSDGNNDKSPLPSCRVAFVRDPLARFISGYVEFEWRFVQAQNKYQEANKDVKKKYTFHRYSLGSKERAMAFIQDLVSFRILDWLVALEDSEESDVGPPPNLKWFHTHIEDEPWLYHREGIAHIAPMVGRLRNFKFDFIGQLENMDNRDWGLMSEACNLQDVYHDFNGSLKEHITSSDPQRTKAAMKAVIYGDGKKEECNTIYKQAICHILSADYDILSNHFPYDSCSNSLPPC